MLTCIPAAAVVAMACSDVLAAPASTTPKAAQELLRKNKKGRLPLVNDKGQLVSKTAFLLTGQQQCSPLCACLGIFVRGSALIPHHMSP